MAKHEAPQPAGHPKHEASPVSASQESLSSIDLSALRQEIEIIQAGAFVRQAGLIHSQLECARRRLDDIVRVGPLEVGEPSRGYQQLKAMSNRNADVAMDVYRKLSEIFEHRAYLYEPAQIENSLKQAYSKLDELVKVGDLLLNEPIWACRRLEAWINGNADVALDVYRVLTKLLTELAQSDFRPTYTSDESVRLAEIHKQIQPESASRCSGNEMNSPRYQ